MSLSTTYENELGDEPMPVVNGRSWLATPLPLCWLSHPRPSTARLLVPRGTNGLETERGYGLALRIMIEHETAVTAPRSTALMRPITASVTTSTMTSSNGPIPSGMVL